MFTYPVTQGDYNTVLPVSEGFCFYIPVTCSRPLDGTGMFENICAQHYFGHNLLELISFKKEFGQGRHHFETFLSVPLIPVSSLAGSPAL